MAIPDYESIMLPLLKYAGDNKEHSISEAIEFISDHFKLTNEEKNNLLPSGQQYTINNRVGWARTYLKKAGLLETPKRAYFNITDLGKKTLAQNPVTINQKFLEKFPGFIEFKKTKNENQEEQESEIKDNEAKTPQELLEYGHQKIQRELAQELLTQVKHCSPKFFERLVVELLIRMGYGGTLKDAGKAVGQSGDGGIDGIIKEDKLGLDIIYIQAKRWENVVGSKEIRNFVGSLVGQKANKGVFITTSNFTREALEYVKQITHKVILIDGADLTKLMIENNVGVSKMMSYDVKKIDTDYFAEE